MILAIGELLVDFISDEYVDTIGEAKSFRMFQGGSPANLCANLHWLGVDTTLVSCIGNDSVGRFITESLLKIGLDDQYIQKNDAYPTSIVMVGRTNGTPDFIAYRMADAQLGSIDSQLVSRSELVHTTAFALSKDPAQKSILDALTDASRQGKEISVDWNYAPQLWGDDGGAVFAQVCDMQPLLKISIDDVRRFSGRKVSVEDARKFLDQFKTKITCLTCGKDGVWYKSSAKWEFQPAKEVLEVKDTTGAGDAFWSGFLLNYSKQMNLESCIQSGLETAAKKLQKLGPLYL